MKNFIRISIVLYIVLAFLFSGCQLENLIEKVVTPAADTDQSTVYMTEEELAYANATEVPVEISYSRAGNEITIFPPIIRKYVPRHIGGDRDFHGHGPRVYVHARLKIYNNDLYVEIYMHAIETKSNWTEARGRRLYKLFDCTGPFRIKTPTASYARYTDNDHSDDYLYPRGLVHYFRCVGDTRGNEAGTRTGVTTRLNPIVIVLR